MTRTQTDTADRHWNAEWAAIEQGSKWLTPEADVIAWAAGLAPGARILDLGAGVGRHALWLAQQGFAVTALDAASEGLAVIARAGGVETGGVETGGVKTVQARMDVLPFADGAFDHVLSWNVIYHGDEDIVLRAIAEIRRVLVPGGTFLGTMLSARRLPHEHATAKGREISRNTWVFDSPETDKIHPHHFCDAAQCLGLFAGFEPLRLEDRQHEKPGSWHWHLLMERR